VKFFLIMNSSSGGLEEEGKVDSSNIISQDDDEEHDREAHAHSSQMSVDSNSGGGSASAAKVGLLKEQMKYLLSRHRLLEQDVYECEAHSLGGVLFREHAEQVRDFFLGDTASSSTKTRKPFRVTFPADISILSLRFPKGSDTLIEDGRVIKQYFEALHSQREQLLRHAEVSLVPEQSVTLVGKSSALMKCNIVIRGSAALKKNILVMLKLTKADNEGDTSDKGQDGSHESKFDQKILRQNQDYHLESSIDILKLYDSLNGEEFGEGHSSHNIDLLADMLPTNASKGSDTRSTSQYSPTIIFPDSLLSQQPSLSTVGTDGGSVSSCLSPMSSSNIHSFSFDRQKTV
jgi:hypothetical protein